MEIAAFADSIGIATQVEISKMPLKDMFGNPIHRLNGEPFQMALASAEMSDDALSYVREEVNRQISLGEDSDKEDADARREKTSRFLARLTKGWNFQNLKTGEDVPFSEDAAFQLYQSTKNAWIRKQVSEWVNNQARFFQPTSHASKTPPVIAGDSLSLTNTAEAN